MTCSITAIVVVLLAAAALGADPTTQPWNPGPFAWVSSAPLVAARQDEGDWHSLKDPSIVFAEGKWHLFCTVRGTQRSHAIVYLSFADWPHAAEAHQYVLPCHKGFFCAPQVFYFAPQKLWYLICQASDPSWSPNYQPAFSTTSNIADPKSWSALKPMFGRQPTTTKAWLDFWVICDQQNAHLFFTSMNGKLWRSQTSLADFPSKWSEPVLALQGDFFEAGHIYQLRRWGEYLAVIEAENGHGWRYFTAYVADRLDGSWRPLAAGKEDAFASMLNLEQPAGKWTDVISHGELIRAGNDQTLEVSPDNLQVLFQGVLDKDRAGKPYGQVPWRLGLLTVR
jgi:hypothetical protein